MEYRLEHKRYQRRLLTPLATGSRTWHAREGILIHLTDNARGHSEYGEIAPLETFGTEVLSEAEACLYQLGEQIDEACIHKVDASRLPCTRFALEACHLKLSVGLDTDTTRPMQTAAVLSLNENSLSAINEQLAAGFDTYKVKIGTGDVERELREVARVAELLQGRGVLRLDANGSLTEAQALEWFQRARNWPVAWIEQPLPAGAESAMLALSSEHGVPVAFDESVAGFASLKLLTEHYPQAIFVVKPLLIGELGSFLTWRQANPNFTLVYSSALETAIGLRDALLIAAADPAPLLPCGFGTGALFTDGLTLLPTFSAGHISYAECEALWEES